MFSTIVDLFGGVARLIFWFVTSVVIPVTIWFTLLRIDVISLKDAQAHADVRMSSIENEAVEKNKDWSNQFEELNRSLGRIEGELKRIK